MHRMPCHARMFGPDTSKDSEPLAVLHGYYEVSLNIKYTARGGVHFDDGMQRRTGE